MTLEEMEAMTCNVLTIRQVADFLGKDPQVIRDQAEREPKYLGFPICKAGHSYCVPRIGFITWARGMTPMMVVDQRVHLVPSSEFSKILFD